MAPKTAPMVLFDGVLKLATYEDSQFGSTITKAELKKALGVLDISGKALTEADLKAASETLNNYSKLLSKGAKGLASKWMDLQPAPVVKRVNNGPSQSEMLVEAPTKELKTKFSVMDGIWIVKPESDLRKVQNFTNGTLLLATNKIDSTIKDPYAQHGEVGRFRVITFDEFKNILMAYMNDDMHKAGNLMTKEELSKVLDGLATFGDTSKLEYYIAGWNVADSMGLGDMFLIYNRETNQFLGTSKCTDAE